MKWIYVSAALFLFSSRASAVDPAVYADYSAHFTENLFAIGIAGTVFENGEFHDFTSGYKNRETAEPIDEHTYMELGSATKTFTGLLLAREVVLGNIRLDDPVRLYFPELTRSHAGDITIVELATHTSGLDRMPDNLVEDNGDLRPYRDYTVDMLVEYLKEAVLDEKIYFYSNTGVALLAQILGRVNGMTYSEMVQRFISEPLGLGDGVAVDWTGEVERRLSKKYSSILNEEPYWTDLNAMNGTGVIKITLAAMKTFMYAQMFPEEVESPLKEAILLSQTTFAEDEEFKIGLGWFMDSYDTTPYLNHNGSTEGFTVEFLFDVVAKRGLIYFSNTDLYSPGLCLVTLFTGGECAKPEIMSMDVVAQYMGSYTAVLEAGDTPDPRDEPAQEDTFGFTIGFNEEHGFFYVEVDGEIQQRLFLGTEEQTLMTDSELLTFKFNDESTGVMTDNWNKVPQTFTFTRSER